MRKYFWRLSILQNCLDDIGNSELPQIGIGLCRVSIDVYEGRAMQRTCPHPTKMIGWPVIYVIESAAPTYIQDQSDGHVNNVKLTNLVIDSVPFGNEHTIYPAAFSSSWSWWEVTKGSVELCQLVNSFIANQCFANKNDLVWVVYRDQLMKKH